AGSFCSQVSEMVGLKLPMVNMVHQYLVTESIPEVSSLKTELPVVRDPRASCYYRQEQSGLIIGPYEMKAEAWGVNGIDWGFDNALLPPDLERLEPNLHLAAKSLPVFETAGIKKVVSGPITHTPDGNFLLGPAPGLRNHWMCCAASIGITQGPGCGKYLAQWMVHGQTEINVREMDPRRFGDWAIGKYALDKSIDEYEQMYATHYPGEFREAGRPVNTTPIYKKLKAQGAVFAETFGWERAKWFDNKSEGEKYSFRRNNSFDTVAEECRAVRERVGLIDLSSFAKYEISGEDAESFLGRICANRLPKQDTDISGKGGVALVHMLTELGGIECEATLTRLDKNLFYMLSAAVAELHDYDWLDQHLLPDEKVTIRNVSNNYGILVLTGPRSRDVMSKLTDADLSNEAFRWMQAKNIELSGIPLRALRVSFVGELGWELHHPLEKMEALYDTLLEAGSEYGIANFGTYAMNSLRMEKAYKGWGSELTTEITPIEAGLERFVDFNKFFLGREATLSRKLLGVNTKLVYVSVKTTDSDCLGNEPVL
ncbi:MAG TPA: aminomethyltransferase, partial [Deltaproteobacteria bacterium]|nr:aminomethyltransferase [Deltaproteobacteria bacterium]